MRTDTPPVIEIRNLRKAYQLGERVQMYGSLREALTRTTRNLWQRQRSDLVSTDERKNDGLFWALKGIDLDIQKGETVAIIGSNGAGKSTLLKIISRITDPTEGQIRVRGRMGSLLKLGPVFIPS